MDAIVLEEPSSSTIYGSSGGGSRAIDRHNPIIRDEKRLGHGRIFPSSSTITITTTTDHHKMPPEVEGGDQKRKSVAFANDDEFIKASDFISPASSSRCLLSDKAKFNFSSEFHHDPPPPPPSPPRDPLNSHNRNALKKKYADLLSFPPPPPASTQPPPSPPPYDHGDDESLSSSPPKPLPSPPPEPLKFHNSKVCNEKNHLSQSSVAPKPTSPQPPQPQPPPPSSSDQVVVLEVSLHCRGCERKMKKHISKIEGVSSFKIDFAAKKITVVGDVTPLAVLASVLKVKNAKLLTPATISSSVPG